MLFLRIYQHLLPSAQAWRLGAPKSLRRLFEGLAAAPAAARDFIDEIYSDLWPSTTRELPEWESQFGLPATGSDATRRLQLAAAWQATGGQSAAYMQGVLHAAGFTNLFVHESFPDPNGPTYVPRDPRGYTEQPIVGTFQCTIGASQPRCMPSTMAGQPRCNAFLANEPGYLVNKDLTNTAPPPVPDDASTWPFFIYIGAESFPDLATVAAGRRAELERLILKIRPTQHWIVTLIEYSATGVFDPTFDETFD